MTLKTVLLDGAPGVTMTAANSGADSVNGLGTNLNTATFSSRSRVHGTSGGVWAMVSGGNVAGAFSRFGLPDTTQFAVAFRGVFTAPTSLPAVSTPVMTMRTSSGRAFQLVYRTDGRLAIYDKVNVITILGASNAAAVIAAGSQVSVSILFAGGSTTASSFTITARDLAGATIATATATNANSPAGEAFTAFDLGVIGNFISEAGWDDVQADTGRTTELDAYAPPANTAPTVDAGPDQDVAPGTVVTLKGTANDAESSVASQVWVCVATPPGVALPTITGANNLTATVALPAGVTGRFRFELKATDDAGATSVPDAVNIYVRGTTTRPTYDISNGGPWSGTVGVLADGADGTYSDSPEGTTVEAARRMGLGPLKPPATFELSVRSMLTAEAPTGVATVRLYEGSTLRKTWTATPGTALASQTFSLSAAEIATISDWLTLAVELSWKVA